MQAKAAAERSAAAAQAEAEQAKQYVAGLQAAPSGEAAESAITRLIQLIYFAMVGSYRQRNGAVVIRSRYLNARCAMLHCLLAPDMDADCAALCGRWIAPAPLRAERLPIVRL